MWNLPCATGCGRVRDMNVESKGGTITLNSDSLRDLPLLGVLIMSRMLWLVRRARR